MMSYGLRLGRLSTSRKAYQVYFQTDPASHLYLFRVDRNHHFITWTSFCPRCCDTLFWPNGPCIKLSPNTPLVVLPRPYIPQPPPGTLGFCLDRVLATATQLVARVSTRSPVCLYSKPHIEYHQITSHIHLANSELVLLVLARSSIACRTGALVAG